MIVKILPYPPTVNHYYGRRGTITFIKTKGRKYRDEVYYKLMSTKLLEGKLKLHIDVYPPDKRKRDLDNINKCLLDSLQYAGIIKDDFDIDFLSMQRHEIVKGGKVIIKLSKIR